MTSPSAVRSEVRPVTLAGLLRLRAAERPEREAFVFLADGGEPAARLTYGELDRRARAIAARLRASLAPGDRALLLYPPGLEFIAAFFGCLYAGVTAVPAYPPRLNDRSQARLRAIVEDAAPRAALTTEAIFAAAVASEALTARVPELGTVRWIATDGPGLDMGQEEADLPEPEPGSVAFLQYTSGSTAAPKGVMVTHANLVHNERMIGEAFRQDEETVVVGWLPLYHDMGLIGNVLQPLHAGARCVLMSPVAFLQQPVRWLRAISRFHGTTSGGPNFAYDLCVRRIPPEERAQLDLSSWRVAFNGAEPVRAETLERFAEAFAPSGFDRAAFYPCYGLAEATLFVTGGAPGRFPRVEAMDAAALERHEARRISEAGEEAEPADACLLVSSGRPWNGQRVVVVDPETAEPVPAGRVGEIWIAGPSVALGYWRNEEATESDFRARLSGTGAGTGEGPFLRTGDYGFLRDGELYVTGRLKDLIIIRGRNHYPQDIERTAERSHPDLRPGCGAAFSVDVGGEERLVIVHEVERRRRDGLDEVATAVRRAVAEEHQVQVQDVILVRAGTVPKTSSGKLQRRACRASYQAGELAVVGGNALGGKAPEVKRADISQPPAAPGRADLLALAPEARRTALERLLRGRAAAAVGRAPGEIDPAQPLTGFGLDSLGAMELKGGIESALGVPVPLAELLEGIGTAGLADLLLPALERAETEEERASGVSESDQTALSWGQRALWFLHRLAPEGGAYNIALAARALGTLDGDALRRAVDLLVARHEALRTVFVVPAEGAEPERRKAPSPPAPLPSSAPAPAGRGETGHDAFLPSPGEGWVGDGRGAGGEGVFRRADAAGWSDAEVAARLTEEAYRPFVLDRGPLLRVLVLDRGDRGEPVLLLTVHHIAADFASLGVIVRDLGALYRQETGGPAAVLPEPVPFSLHVRREREMLAGPRGERLWDFWREMLAGGRGPVPDLDLPADRPRPPVQTWLGGARTVEIPADLAERLRAFAAAHGATLFMTLLAAFQAQLGRISGQEDLAVGSPFAGRGAPELAEAVGYLVNPVPLRADLAGDPAFAELLARTRAAVVAGLEHGDFPFALLAERLRPVRDPSRSPLFQTMFLVQRGRLGHPNDPPGLATFALGESGGRIDLSPALTLESLRLDERRAQLDLTLRVAEETVPAGPARLRASLEYNSGLFDGATAERMLGHFITLLAGAVADPAASRTPVSRLPLLTAAERTAVLVDWNAPAPGHPAGHRQDLLLHQPFEAQAALTPEAEALVAESRLTYAELSRRANQLAWHLQAMGVGPEVRVGVHLPRSADLVVSLLAVLKAGGAYVPLDPSYPRERLELMLADSGARLVIEDGMAAGGWAGASPRRVRLAAERDVLAAYSGADPPAAALPGNLAYLIYTSGSTGRPKAVAVEHRSAAVLVQWARRVFAPAELAGVLAATSVAFDLSVFELFVPLSWGGRVILAENALELPRLAAAGEVTLVNTVPSALAELVRGGGLPASVRTVNLAGEPVPRALVDAVHALPGVERLYNLYGPSEDTTYSTFALLAAGEPAGAPAGAPVPIGLPVDDTVAYVVDRCGEPVPVGVPGELWLGGAGLARGYLGRPGLTAERFVPDPFTAEVGGARLYRTGDLVRRRGDRLDGRLDFLGRIDHQVKIRGFRIELGEVEAALTAHPEVREAVVLALPEPGGAGRRLVAYVVGSQPATLRAHLQERLPDAFIPTAWVVLPALPLSPNGKVDRKALAAIEPQTVSGAAATAGTPVEEAVAGLFAEALGVPAVGAHDDFFALGGHSLLATRVLGRVARLFAVDLPVSALFQAPTAARLASRIAAAAGGAASAPPIVPVSPPHEDAAAGFPLSFAQQRLWFLAQLQPGGAAYNMPGAVLLEGPLHPNALAAALSAVARRHESLRTRFAGRGGRPVQIVDPPAPVALPVVDLTALPETARETAAAALAAAEAARPFDLTRGRLLRALLLRLSAERHLELVTLHHIVADGWSLGVLVAELAAFYRGKEPAPLAVQYADFTVWQRQWLAGGALAPLLAWWKERLAGAPTRLELPADRPRRAAAARTEQGVHVHAPLSRELAAELRGLAPGTTLFMVLLAAFEALLARITGQDDLLLGSVVANRTRPETEGLIGLFANTLVLRARLEDDPPFTTALARARETALGAWTHQDLPLEVLVEELHPERETGRTPLFQAVLVLQNAPLSLTPLELPGLTLRRVPVDSATAKFDLTLEVAEEADGGLGGLEMAWELSRDLFDAATGHRLAGWLGALLRGAVAAPGKPLSELPLLDGAERRQLLADWHPAMPGAPLATPVHRLFEEWAARAPERIAVVSAGGEPALTYGELNARANRLARHLRTLGVGPETRVGVAVERSPEQVTAFLAVLKAGGAYVPMDLSDPLERLAAMDAAAEVELLLSEELLAADAGTVAAQPAENLSGSDAGTLAYVMFTSGSTGRPKAVAVEHRGIVRLVRGARGKDSAGFADFGPDQVVLQLAPTAFDASTLEIWGALLGGGRLVLAPGGVPSLDDLAALLERHGVTTLWLTAGLFHLVVEERIGTLRGLAQLLAGGDVLAPEAVNRVLAELPGVRLINGYGPTENTTFTCCYAVREPVLPGDTVPIGRPIAGTRVQLLDRRQRPVPAGVAGELFAGGAGLARGYLGRPDLTAERFVPDALAGEIGEPGARLYRTGDLARWRPAGSRGGVLEFLGRADRQVKIRGFRVEPGEVETVLAGHPEVARAAVLVLGDTADDRRLVACVVAARAKDDLAPALRSWLAERLPAWLVPSVALVAELPLTANGKVDRAALALLVAEREGAEDTGAGSPLSPSAALPARAHPLDPAEELLAGILAEVLGVERVGLHDDFFALGGHSLLATRAVSRIVDALQVELPLSGFFATPTVAGLAERLRTARGAAPLPPVVPVPRDVPLPLSFAQQRLWLLERLRPGGTAYSLPVAARLTGDLAAAVLARCLSEIVRRHEALRTVFADDGGRPVQLVRPAGPATLTCIDLSGLAATERWDLALDLAAGEAALPFDLATGPVVRFALVALGKTDHLLVAAFHPIAADGWSLPVFLGELAALYGAFAAGRPTPLPALPVQYGDFAVWQRKIATGPAFARSLAFWRWRLADAEPLALATDRPHAAGAAGAFAGDIAALDLAGLSAPVALRAREAGATRFMVLLCGVLGWLSRLTGQTDLTISTPTAGRDRVETEGLIGFFAKTLPLRTDLAGDPALDDLLPRVRAAVLEAYGNGAVPFERLIEELHPERSAGRAPFAGFMLSYLSQPPIPAIPGLGLAPLELSGREAKPDLELEVAVHERDGALSGLLEGRAGRFEAATLARMAAHLRTLLAGALAEPARRLSELPLLSAAEREEIAARSRSEAAAAPARKAVAAIAAPAVAGIARLVEAGGQTAAGAAPPLRRRQTAGDAPLSFAQQRLWFLHQLEPESPAYHVAGVLHLAGPLRPGVLARALERIAVRHEALRTVFVDSAAAGGPVQRVLPPSPFQRMPVVDLGGLAAASAAAESLGLAEARRLFDLERGPLFRALLLRLAAGEHRLVVVMHHIISDGWSMGVMAGELAALYDAFAADGVDPLPELALQVADVAVWQRSWLQGEVLDHQLAWWRERLAGAPSLELADDRPRPPAISGRGGRGASLPVVLPADLTHDLHALARGAGATLFMTLLGAFAVLLQRWSGEDDLTVGSPIANRERWEIEPLIGCFVNTLPLRVHLDGDPTFQALLGQVREMALGAYDHQGVPFEKLVEDLVPERDRARTPLFQVMLVLQNAPQPPFTMGGLTLALRELPTGTAKFDLTLSLAGEGGELRGALEYSAGLFLPATAERLSSHFGALLRSAAATPGRRISELSWLTAGERAESLRTGRELPAHLVAAHQSHRSRQERRTPARRHREEPAGRAAEGGRPRTPTEELLAALWCEVLGREQVGVHDSFFDLGGHSLLATRLASRVRATFGSEIPLARLFDAPTVAELARVLDEDRGTGAGASLARTAPIRPIPRAARGGDLPLSFAQERLWFLDRIQVGAGVYNVPLALRLRGALEVSRMAAAFGAIVARHEALRTVFPERDGDPVQRIQPPADPALWRLPVVDLAALPEPAAREEARRLAIADSLVPFSLESGPLLRTTLLRLAAAEHLLLLDLHHIVSDGWSLGVLLGELSAFYGGAGSGLPGLPVQYADFAAWQREWLRGGELERQTAYWKRQIAGAPAVLELPTDRPRPLVQSWRGAQIPILLPAPLTARLAALCRRQGATQFMLLLAAWDALLHRHSGQRDLNVGSPIAGRNRAETERLIGFFVNTLVLRSTLDTPGDDPSFAGLLARTRRTALAAYDHQDLPFEKLVDEIKPERTMSHEPLFQVMFALQNTPLGALELPGGLSLEPLELRAVVAKFDLTLSLMESRVSGSGGSGGTAELGGMLEYNSELFDAASMIRLLGHFQVLLEEVGAAGPGPSVSALPLLTAAERHQLLVEWCNAPGDPLGRCMHELFEITVAADPEALAVVWEDMALSYGELNRRANQLAWHLIALGVRTETRVGLCVERSAEMLVGMLGVLKAGGAYVPIDPAYPRERVAFMLEDTRSLLLVTQERLRELLPAGPVRVLCLDADWGEISRRPAGNPPPAAVGSSTAYVIYTSGSTGTPKGVVTSHDAVVAYTQASSAVYRIRPGDRNLQFSSISFDASVEEIYGCLTHGATLYVRGDVQEGISEFFDRCRAQKITLLQFPTAFWHQLATAMEAESLTLPPTIRAMFVGGEKMLAQRLISWWRLLPPGLRFINAYGPTETTVAATVCQLPDEAPIDDGLREVPLGRPLVHARGYVLDRELRPVPIGVTGEMLVGGLGLARGYLDRPALTAEKFVPNPYAGLWGQPGERLYRTGDLVRLLPGGLLEFVGRADGQMKLRGYRIEPGEIEATLAGHPGVGQVVVLAREDAAGDVRLVAYAAAKGEPVPEPAALREYLAERLPSYMVPQTVHVLPEMPVSAQGKVDRLALARLTPEVRRERTAWAAPQNEVEQRIAAVWRELFGLNDLNGPDGIGADDNFFDSGGSSLLLVKLHSRLQKALERTFPLVEIFKHPTIRTLAASLESGQPARPALDKARTRTDTRRESMRQMQQLREQRRGRTRER